MQELLEAQLFEAERLARLFAELFVRLFAEHLEAELLEAELFARLFADLLGGRAF